MSLATVASAFRARMEALTLSPALPIVWQGDEFNPEADGGESGWIYFQVYLTQEGQTTFGSATNSHRDEGLAIANIVKPRGTKIGTVEVIADAIRAHFLSESVTGAHITSRIVGEDRLLTRDSRWQVTPVIMQFWADRLEASS